MQRQPRKRSLSLAAAKLSFSAVHSMRPKSSGLELQVQGNDWREPMLTARSGFLPIRRTGESVRRLLRRASHSLKFHPSNNGRLMFSHGDKKVEKDHRSLKPLSEAKVKSINGDNESGFCQDENDCFYASDTLAVRKGMPHPFCRCYRAQE